MVKHIRVKNLSLFLSVIFTSSCSTYGTRPSYNGYLTKKVTPSNSINSFKEESQKRDLDSIINTGQLVKPKFLTPNVNKDVKMWVKYFSTRGKDRFERYLVNGEKYRPLIEKVFQDHKLPTELYFVGLIESGYYLKAKSHADAVGPWQFIKETGKRYGLTIRHDVDERQSIVKATKAAAVFFQDLYNIFGSWELALSAYNAGEYGIIRRIRKANSRDFYVLSKGKHLPKETRHYVPKVLAAMEVYNHPERYNIKIPVYSNNMFNDLKELKLNRSVYISQLSKKMNISTDLIKTLNPDLKRNATPYMRKGYRLILPGTTSSVAIAKAHTIKAIKKSSRKLAAVKTEEHSTYKVVKGDNLYGIARKFNTNISEIIKMNRLKKRTVYIGQKLKLPSYEVKTYTVRSGDFLIHIAKKHKVSVTELKEINSMRNSKIYPGQKLIVAIN